MLEIRPASIERLCKALNDYFKGMICPTCMGNFMRDITEFEEGLYMELLECADIVMSKDEDQCPSFYQGLNYLGLMGVLHRTHDDHRTEITSEYRNDTLKLFDFYYKFTSDTMQ
jgi:hypothetical protein